MRQCSAQTDLGFGHRPNHNASYVIAIVDTVVTAHPVIVARLAVCVQPKLGSNLVRQNDAQLPDLCHLLHQK